MTTLIFIERLVIPVVVVSLLVGGIAGTALGLALVYHGERTLALIWRMNRWVSSRRALRVLEMPLAVEPPPAADGRRPLLGTFLAIGGVAAVVFLLTRLRFDQPTFVPGVDLGRWLLSSIAVHTAKWVLVVGSAFACIVGLAMLFAPARYAALEASLNHWYSTRRVAPGNESMRLTLEPHVLAHPRASGWLIAVASLAIALAMATLLVTRVH